MAKAVKNVFAKAKVVAPSKAAKKEAPTAALPQTREYAAICLIEQAVKATKERIKAVVDSAIQQVFIKEGVVTGIQPGNFKAEANDAVLSAQLKTRSTVSVLTEAEIELCEQHNIPTKTIAGKFYINPKYAENEEAMEEYGIKIAKLGLPEDLFLKEPDKVVASKEGIAKIFATKDFDLLSLLLPVQTTVAVKPTTTMTVEQALELVNDELQFLPEE